jgi:hypothetical protein
VAVAGRNEWLGDLEADTAAQAPSSERKIEHAFESTLLAGQSRQGGENRLRFVERRAGSRKYRLKFVAA